MSLVSHSKTPSKNKKQKTPLNKKTTEDFKKNSQSSKEVLKKFKKSLKILTRKPILSDDYTKTVTFLESNLYYNAHFDTLNLLTEIYKKNGDFLNQLKVLNILVTDYPKNPLSHYKLGLAYKELFLKNHKPEDKKNAINNLSNAIKINRKYELAYTELLPLLLKKDTHTKSSLSLTMEMIRYIRKPIYYSYLCKAYFDNKYLTQSQRACKKAIAKNPEDPQSKMLYALSQEIPRKVVKKVINLSKEYKKSFYIQFKTGLFFMETNPTQALLYLNTALKLDPTSVELLQTLSKFLFNQGQYKKSYKYFLKACILSKGSFMLEFQKAKSRVAHKDETLIPLFKKGIEKCFNSIKSKKTKKPSSQHEVAS